MIGDHNGYIERFNRLYREAILDAYLFFDLDQVRQLTAEWIEEYNQRRPHEGQGNLTPFEWKESLVKMTISLKLLLFLNFGLELRLMVWEQHYPVVALLGPKNNQM